uniref:PDZ domain-containing protein n=3 Tax=Mesocestoides corti TaxID=53468 RepID=A0A5K3F2Y7_MESCO
MNAILIFLRMPEFPGIGVNYVDNEGHFMWLPCEGTLYDIDFYKERPAILLFLRIRFFASDILRISPLESVFQHFLYGVTNLEKLELPKCILQQLLRIKSFILTGDRSYILSSSGHDEETSFPILRGFSDSSLTCRGEALLRFLEFLYRLPCFNGHFYEFENEEEAKIFLIVILPTGLRRYEVLKQSHDIREDYLIPWKNMRAIFVEDNYLSVEHIQKQSSESKSKLVTTSWLCPSHWHATNLCAEVIHQRLWHLSEVIRNDGSYNVEESPMEARVCRAFELSRWLERHYPTKSNRWTPSRIGIADRRDGNGGGVADEKTPRTRRRDARRAALRSQKCGRHPTGATAAELNHSPESWSAHQIARHFQHITGEEAKRISSLIESWQLGDRQRLLDTSLSLSKLNALGGAVGNQRAPPPRPPETYRQQLQPQNKSNSTQSDQPKRDFREASKTPKLDSSKFTAFWRRQEVRKHEGGARRRGSREDEKHELIETAAELKWLIAENSRLLADLCNEEKKLTGRLPSDCIPECGAGHMTEPLTVITRSITCQSPVNFSEATSIPLSVTSKTRTPPSTSDPTSSVHEHWSLKQVPLVATDHFGSSENNTVCSSERTTATQALFDSHLSSTSHQQSTNDEQLEISSTTQPQTEGRVVRNNYEMMHRFGEPKAGCQKIHNGRAGTASPTPLPKYHSRWSESPTVPGQRSPSNFITTKDGDIFHFFPSNPSFIKPNQCQYPQLYRPQALGRRRAQAYEFGDDDLLSVKSSFRAQNVSRQGVSVKDGPVQWSVGSVAPPPVVASKLSAREKTPGPERAHRSYLASQLGGGEKVPASRQSCPPICGRQSSLVNEKERSDMISMRKFEGNAAHNMYSAYNKPQESQQGHALRSTSILHKAEVKRTSSPVCAPVLGTNTSIAPDVFK